MSKSKCPLKRAEIQGIVKRFLKEGAYVAARDIPAFYNTYALFPDKEFWLTYQLDFQLNAINWFLTQDGQEKLKTDLALFRLDIKPNTEYHLEPTKTGEDIKVIRPKTTLADILK